MSSQNQQTVNSFTLKVRKKFKHSLKAFATEKQIIELIVDYVQTHIPHFSELKNSIEFIEHIAQITYDHLPKNKTKNPIDLSHTIIQIFQKLFQDIDIHAIQQQVKYLEDNKIIQKTGFLMSFYIDSKFFILKKLGIA